MIERTIISVGDGPQETVYGQGAYLDGDVAVPQPVVFIYDDAQRALVWDDQRWPYDDLRQIRDQAGDDQIVLRRSADPTARLILTNRDDQFLVTSRAKKLKRFASPVRRGRLIAWALAAVASVALIIFVLNPILADQMAEFLPPEGEKALGDATFEQIRTALDETGFSGLQDL